MAVGLDQAAKTNAAAALWCLATSAANRKRIANADGLESLVELVEHGDPQAKAHAAGMLRYDPYCA